MSELKKRHVLNPKIGSLVTQLLTGQTIKTDGPATFKIIEMKHQGHQKAALVLITANKSVTITKE